MICSSSLVSFGNRTAASPNSMVISTTDVGGTAIGIRSQESGFSSGQGIGVQLNSIQLIEDSAAALAEANASASARDTHVCRAPRGVVAERRREGTRSAKGVKPTRSETAPQGHGPAEVI